jgi:hypothetical protein
MKKNVIVLSNRFFSDGRKVDGADIMKDKELKLDEIEASHTLVGGGKVVSREEASGEG